MWNTLMVHVLRDLITLMRRCLKLVFSKYLFQSCQTDCKSSFLKQVGALPCTRRTEYFCRTKSFHLLPYLQHLVLSITSNRLTFCSLVKVRWLVQNYLYKSFCFATFFLCQSCLQLHLLLSYPSLLTDVCCKYFAWLQTRVFSSLQMT